MKNSNDTIGNRTRDFPTCRAVPQPTALPRAPTRKIVKTKILARNGLNFHCRARIWIVLCSTASRIRPSAVLAEQLQITVHHLNTVVKLK